MLLVDGGDIKVNGSGLDIATDIALLTHTLYDFLSEKMHSREEAANFILGAAGLGFAPVENLEKATKEFYDSVVGKSE